MVGWMEGFMVHFIFLQIRSACNFKLAQKKMGAFKKDTLSKLN
jgi:hypothetical protein